MPKSSSILRASKMNGALETFSDEYDEERFGGVSENLENLGFSEKMNLSDGYEDDVISTSSSLSKAPRRGNRFGNISNLDNNIHGPGRAKGVKEYEDLRFSDINGTGFRRSGHMPDKRFIGRGEKGENEGFRSSQMIDMERDRYSSSSSSVGGPSKNHSDFRYGESLKDGYDEGRFNRVEYTGDDRAELLKKIDELKDQLSRSGEMANKPMSKNPRHGWNAHHDHYNASEDSFSDSSSGINRPFVQHPFPDSHPDRVSYMNHYAEPSAFVKVHPVGSRRTVYPSGNPRSHIQGINDPLRSQMPMRVQHAPAPFQEQQNQNYLSEHYINGNLAQMSAYETHAPNMNHHHSSCTCLYCYNKNEVPVQRFSGIPRNQVPNHLGNPVGLHDSHDYDLRVQKTPQLQSFDLQTHSRFDSEVDSEVNSFVPVRPPRIQPSTGTQYCRTIAGGAPFITCNICFESLKVPKNVMVQNGIKKKMRCGPCSSILVLDVSNTGLVVSVNESIKESPAAADDRQKVKLIEGRHERVSMTLSSEDYDHSGYEFQSLDREVVPPIIHQQISTKTGLTKSLQSSSTCEEEANLDPMAASPKGSNPSELPIKGKQTSPVSGSSLQEFIEHPTKYHRGDRFGEGNKSRHSDPESLAPNKTTSRKTSMNNASEASEIDMSTNEYGNTVTSLDSEEASEEGDQLRAKNAAFLAGIKSNPKDDQERTSVTVNGSLVPVRLLKTAEKVAGPIRPGNYWYDFQAGFWGVMGGPCRGIIPAFIEEFNHMMPENCAGGNTRVFVNGRELYETDFNLLVRRGLPDERNRSYNIKISGTVFDAETGEELESLGKLAPTVERLNHGFGMKPPKATARQD